MPLQSPLRPTLILLALSVCLHGSAGAQDGPWALTNARIETVTRGVIERGTILVRDGLIQAVGTNIKPPADARIVDLSNRTVYPGLIDLASSLGLAAPAPSRQDGAAAPAAALAGPASAAPANVGLEPGRLIASELRLTPSDARAARNVGITAVLVAPARGAFRGLSALVPLRDDSATRFVVRSPVALHMGFQGVQGSYPATLLGVIAYQRQAFYDAKRHALMFDRYRASARGMARPSYDAGLDALVPVVRGALPAFFAANSENEMRRALRIGKEFDLRLTVVGATEGFRAMDALDRQRPLVVSVDFPRSTDVTGWSYRASQRREPNDSSAADSAVRKVVEGNAAALHRAGIRFALASGSLRPAEFLANVRKVIAAGLPRDVALQALTVRAAEIAGAGEQLGGIEAGKIANLVVAENDILGDSAKIRMVFVDGIRYLVIEQPRGQRAGSGREGGGGTEASAQMAGTWDVTVNNPQGVMQATLTVTQSGDALDGTMMSEMGTVSISDGRVSGRSVAWTVTMPLAGQTTTVVFRGTVDGTRMTGTASLGESGSMTFTAEKKP